MVISLIENETNGSKKIIVRVVATKKANPPKKPYAAKITPNGEREFARFKKWSGTARSAEIALDPGDVMDCRGCAWNQATESYQTAWYSIINLDGKAIGLPFEIFKDIVDSMKRGLDVEHVNSCLAELCNEADPDFPAFIAIK